MGKLRAVAVLAIAGMIAVGCGDRSATVQAPPPARTAAAADQAAGAGSVPVAAEPATTDARPAPTAQDTASTAPDTTPDTVGDTDGASTAVTYVIVGGSWSPYPPPPTNLSVPPDPEATTGTAPPDATTDPGQAPSTTMLAGDVAITDPLPAQADAASDLKTAETDVRYAYQHWILLDLDKTLRGRLVEDGEIKADKMDQALHAASGLVGCARLGVDLVQFTDAENALVSFRVLCRTNPSPYFPNQLTGTAVFRNGTWRISSRTLCLLAFSTGVDCAGLATDNPVQPTAFQLTSVPDGYVWSGGAPADVFASTGFADWIEPVTGSVLDIETQGLAGSSKLDASDADFVLTSPRFGTALGTAVQIGSFVGRVASTGSGATLAYLRNDDVIVHITASGLSAEQLVALAASIVPTDMIPGDIVPSVVPGSPPGGAGLSTTAVTTADSSGS